MTDSKNGQGKYKMGLENFAVLIDKRVLLLLLIIIVIIIKVEKNIKRI